MHVLFPQPLWPVHTHNDINDIVVGETPNTSAGQRLESIVKQLDSLTRQSSFLQNHFDPETNISQTCHKPYPYMQTCKHDANIRVCIYIYIYIYLYIYLLSLYIRIYIMQILCK